MSKDNLLSVRLKRQRDGRPRPHWYGQYMVEGRYREINLNIRWQGTPPASGKGGERGDTAFEISREKARTALTDFVDESKRKGRAEHLTERLIESKTGRAVSYVRIDDLHSRWISMRGRKQINPRYAELCRMQFQRFDDFLKTRNPKAVYLYEIATEDAEAYLAWLWDRFAAGTVRFAFKLVANTVPKLLPAGAVNPFAGLAVRRETGRDEVVHRRPFTAEELKRLLDTTRDDPFLYPLIVTAACTGMRCGDVCHLNPNDVDLDGGMIVVKTAKTGAQAEIPIFPPLREVLIPLVGSGKSEVFPEAALMHSKNPAGLTYRLKKAVVRALESDTPLPYQRVDPSTVRDRVKAAIETMPDTPRRARILDSFDRYASGQSVRRIEKETGSPRSTVSADLHAAETVSSIVFMPAPQTGASVRNAIARTTRVNRQHGQKSASVKDWHTLRTTFVTLALTAGVPVELVKRITGHQTTEIVLANYFRPDRESFRAALAGALPDVLTEATVPAKPALTPQPKTRDPADELVELADKARAGNATASDRKRIKALAARL